MENNEFTRVILLGWLFAYFIREAMGITGSLIPLALLGCSLFFLFNFIAIKLNVTERTKMYLINSVLLLFNIISFSTIEDIWFKVGILLGSLPVIIISIVIYFQEKDERNL
ncbi:hypothetical protein WAK64_06225 [Bacillus spongiae]|uniref:Uncharacterized protein n=1 Tax=Bacillus spongiae TaxID=2683610 RepID=A0ABU8HBN4_9BACI